jgi:hypothetical protein
MTRRSRAHITSTQHKHVKTTSRSAGECYSRHEPVAVPFFFIPSERSQWALRRTFYFCREPPTRRPADRRPVHGASTFSPSLPGPSTSTSNQWRGLPRWHARRSQGFTSSSSLSGLRAARWLELGTDATAQFLGAADGTGA